MKDVARGNNGRGGPGRAIHPGSGRRKAAPFPRGRVLGQEEVAAVKALLADKPRERALLIEYLHLIQDKEGCLPEGHLHALAEELKIPMAEVYEVATFYAHFDVVGSDEERPPKVTIRVCDSLSCMLAGAERLLAEMQAAKLPGVRVVRAPCIGSCDTAPAAEVGHHHVDRASAAKLGELALGGHVHPEMPAYQDFDAHVRAGGYAVLRSCISGARKAEEVIAALSDGGLRGLGGAGFPTGRKWGLVRAEKGPRLMAVNGDEGEPGTFKDRIYLEKEPHKFLEGMLTVAATIPDAAARDQFADRLAHKARITESVIRDEIRKTAGQRKTVAPASAVPAVARVRMAEQGLLWALVHRPVEGLAAVAQLEAEDLEGLVAAPILRLAGGLLDMPPDMLPELLRERLSEGERAMLDQAAAAPAEAAPSVASSPAGGAPGRR
jgi:NADH:ubiquinone oxidoreductase subunit E